MTSMVLSTLPGVGQRLAQKITEHFGGEDEAIASLKSGDIARIAEIDGVSPKRALSLARMVAGQSGSFLATKEAERLHRSLLQDIVSFASCAATRERMQLLMPIENPAERRLKVSHAMNYAQKHAQSMNALASLFQNLRQTRFNNERTRSSIYGDPASPKVSSQTFSIFDQVSGSISVAFAPGGNARGLTLRPLPQARHLRAGQP